MIKKTNLFILIGLLLWSLQGISMEKPITKEYKLNNGLKILVREDHRAPVVVAQIWYKVGSSKEYYPTGLSHALEHMMFQGTPKLPAEQFSKLISQYGGRDNAFTAEDFTAYYEELDAAHLAISFEVEADRMSHLTLAPEAFAKEIQVVIEERRMRTDDNPQSITWERFMAAANVSGPYHHPVIGWQSDLDNMKVEELRHWYESWYAPNNATIVVVGDVQPEAVLQLAEKYFGSIPSRPVPTTPVRKEIASIGERRVIVEIPAKLPYAIWGYDVPSLKTTAAESDVYALVVLAALLDGGDSARLPKELVRGSQMAADINIYYDPLKQHDTQFVISAVPTNGITVEALQKKIEEQLDKIKKVPASKEELQKVKAQVLAGQVFEKDSMSEQAITLGILETVGLPWQLADNFYDKIQAVTALQVQQVATQYLQPTRRTMAELIPLVKKAKAPN